MAIVTAPANMRSDNEGAQMGSSLITHCTVFDRIVCAIDGSAASREAARQAGVLRDASGTIALVGVG